MGASASASSFAEIQKIYEARKDKLSDEDLMREILACVAAREGNGVVKSEGDNSVNAVESESGGIELKREVDDDPEAQKQRSELFLYACGAYRKETQTAQANLTEATNLWFQGVDTRFKDSDKWTALHHAAGEGHTKVVEFLIQECKANLEEVDEFNCSALWVAACNDRRDAVKVLLIAGADTEIQGKPEDEPSQKPALAARRNRHPGLGDLIDAEAELRAADPMRKQRQLSQEMTLQEFNESMRSSLKGGNQGAAV